MGVCSFDISIMNDMDPSLDEFRNVFIQFGHFIRYRKWPLIEMYISISISVSGMENRLKRIQPQRNLCVCAHTGSIRNLFYMHLFDSFFATLIF